MSAPAIRAALEAGEDALMQALDWVDDGSMDFEPRETARAAVAATVAAVLRELPGRYLETVQGPMMSMRHLAAAIEEARDA